MGIGDMQISDSIADDIKLEDLIGSNQIETEEMLNLKKLEGEALEILIDSLPNLSDEEIANSIKQIYVSIGIYGNIDAEALGRLDDYNLIRLILLFGALNNNESTYVSEYFVLIREARRRELRIPGIDYEVLASGKR